MSPTGLSGLFEGLSLSSSPWVLLLVGSILSVCTAWVVYQQFLSPLAGIPGPFEASISKTWITRLSIKRAANEVIPALHRKHGPLVRIGPNDVSIIDPAAVQQIYTHGSRFRKSDWYTVWQGRRKFDLFPEQDERIHGHQRRMVAWYYSADSIRKLENYVDDTVALFVKKMEALSGGVVDMGLWVQLLAFDVIGEVTFSKRFGFLDQGRDDGTFLGIRDAIDSAAWTGQVPWLYWINDWLSPIFGSRLAITARHGSLRQLAAREVQARFDREGNHDDILGQLSDQSKKRPEDFDKMAVLSMVTSNVFAGSDTTAITMRSVIYHTLRNEGPRQKLLNEILEAKKRGELSMPVKASEAESMPYLQATIQEALRMHPIIGMNLLRTVPKEGFQACGRFFPGGTVIGTHMWALHFDKEVFGPDSDQFSPDRWLTGDVDKMRRNMLSFGAGARLCLGKNLAWMEIEKVIATLFSEFDLKLAEPEKEWKLHASWFVIQSGVDVVLTKRP